MTLTWNWREESHVSAFFARRTQHSTIWTGIHDLGAIDYARKHNISQYYEGYSLAPMHLGFPFYKPTCCGYFYSCNVDANFETTIFHDNDPEEKSGESIWISQRDEWYLCTRGQKLRTIKKEIEFFTTFMEGGGETDLWKMICECLGAEKEIMIERLQKDFECCEWALKSYMKLKEMVEKEKEGDWDWRVGLREQCDERIRQGVVIEGFVKKGAKGKSMLGEALGLL